MLRFNECTRQSVARVALAASASASDSAMRGGESGGGARVLRQRADCLAFNCAKRCNATLFNAMLFNATLFDAV